MGQAAYNTLIKTSGTSTSFTDEVTTNISGNLYQIDDTVKQILDRFIPVIVESDGLVVSSSDYTIDYLFGIIIFSSSQSGAITVTGNYLPTLFLVGANQYSIDISGDILEDTNFASVQDNGGFRTKLYGMLDVAASMTRFDDLSKTFKTKLKNRDVILLEIKPGNGNEIIRGWFIIETTSSQGEISSLEMEDLNFQLDGDISSAFSWRIN